MPLVDRTRRRSRVSDLPADDPDVIQEGDAPPPEALRPQDLGQAEEDLENEAAVKSLCEEWSYVQKNKDGSWTCNACKLVARGGPPRIRAHLAGNSNQIRACREVAEDVKVKFRKREMELKKDRYGFPFCELSESV
jgi:hypothetical protein